MSDTSSLLVKGGLVIGAAYLGYLAYDKKTLPGQAAASPTSDKKAKPKTPAKPSPTQIPLSVFPLKRGSRGDYVKALQKNLGVTADGIFGAATESALLQRYGKKQVLTLTELNTIVSTSTSVTPPAAKPSVPNTAFQKKLSDQILAVFNAIWTYRVIGGKKQYYVRVSIDNTIIANTLASMNDTYLKGFANAYAKSFTSYTFRDTRTGTLLNDLNNVSSLKATPMFIAQLTRVQKL